MWCMLFFCIVNAPQTKAEKPRSLQEPIEIEKQALLQVFFHELARTFKAAHKDKQSEKREVWSVNKTPAKVSA